MKRSILGYQVLLLVTALCLSGCARTHEVWRKPVSMTRSELKKALKEDWRARRQTDEVRKAEWSTCTQRTEPESVCGRARAPRLVTVKLDKFIPEPGVMDVATALYCPQENAYWIEETKGEEKLTCRLLGPFDLNGGATSRASRAPSPRPSS